MRMIILPISIIYPAQPIAGFDWVRAAVRSCLSPPSPNVAAAVKAAVTSSQLPFPAVAHHRSYCHTLSQSPLQQRTLPAVACRCNHRSPLSQQPLSAVVVAIACCCSGHHPPCLHHHPPLNRPSPSQCAALLPGFAFRLLLLLVPVILPATHSHSIVSSSACHTLLFLAPSICTLTQIFLSVNNRGYIHKKSTLAIV